MTASNPVTHGTVLLAFDGEPLSCRGQLVDGTTYVSVTDLAADLGLTVAQSLAGDYVSVRSGDKIIELVPGRSTAVVSGHELAIPFTQGTLTATDGQIMAPLRFVLENIGYKIDWKDRSAQTPPSINITPRKENKLVVGTVRERYDTATLLVDIQYPKIWGLSDDILEPMNRFFSGRFGDAWAQASENEQALIEEAGPNELARQTQLIANYSITYNENDIIGMLLDTYLYTGGAHGGTLRVGYTADILTGKAFSLKDMFKPDTDYVSKLNAEIRRQIDERDLSTIAPFTSIKQDQDFYIADGSLVVFFQQYELMPYAYGFPEFRIPISLLSDCLSKEFLGLVDASGPVEYKNDSFGFVITLPATWEGYTVTQDQWQSSPPGEYGPLLSVRHPLWSSDSPRQDIPVMVFTLDQWDRLEKGEFHIGAAPMNPTVLGSNDKYVLALPARYNYAFPEGYQDVDEILKNQPFHMFNLL